jgi:hypothetical protein
MTIRMNKEHKNNAGAFQIVASVKNPAGMAFY